MAKSKIEREDIISNDAIKNVNRLSFEIDRLDGKLKSLAEKYKIPYNKVWDVLNNIKLDKDLQI